MSLFTWLFCKHVAWKKRPDRNVLYCAGEEGAFAYECTNCGKIALVDNDRPPGKDNPPLEE